MFNPKKIKEIMAVYISPVGLGAAAVPNTLNFLATFKERLCYKYSINATTQPASTVTYTTGTPKFNGTTVFIPITATITITTQSNACGCNPHVQTFTENFEVAFQGQTGVPTSVTLTSVGIDKFASCVNQCGIASAYTINDSLTVTITPPAAAAAAATPAAARVVTPAAQTATTPAPATAVA